jgi:D-alanine-D-alanine ligase
MKIVVLTHLAKEGTDKVDGVVPQVADALRGAGHDVSVLAVHDDVRQLVDGLGGPTKPDLVFNLMEAFGKTQFGSIGVVGLLDLLGVRYTGGGPGEFYLAEDKSLTKKLLAFNGVRYPDFAVYREYEDLESGGSLRMPLIVKPLRMEASIGIDGKAIVKDTKEMLERVAHIHRKIKDSALVEEYIEGREFYVGVLGNQNPTALPPIEIDFSGLPPGVPRIMDHRAKWVRSSVEYKGTKALVAQVSDELRGQLQQAALAAYRALRVRDYGRIDLRLTEAGEIFVIEVNASCYLEKGSEFAQAAGAAGMEYGALLNRIAELALERYR